jgi:hypothetical protein
MQDPLTVLHRPGCSASSRDFGHYALTLLADARHRFVEARATSPFESEATLADAKDRVNFYQASL